MKYTWLDRILNQKILLYAFVGLVTLAATFHLWTSTKISPDEWSYDMLKSWLRKNHIPFEETDSQEVLIEKIKIAMEKV